MRTCLQALRSHFEKWDCFASRRQLQPEGDRTLAERAVVPKTLLLVDGDISYSIQNQRSSRHRTFKSSVAVVSARVFAAKRFGYCPRQRIDGTVGSRNFADIAGLFHQHPPA